MSAGHLKHHHLVADLSQVMADVRVKRRLAQPFSFNFDYDIPYLGGCSEDGNTVFIDRHFPNSILIQDRPLNVLPLLSVHERTENALMHLLKYSYSVAHHYATAAEHKRLLEVIHHGRFAPHDIIQKYEAALRPYIKSDEHEPIHKVPKNLDLRPYQGSDGLLKKMKEAMV